MEKEILRLLAILTEDVIYKQVYARQIKLLLDMLEREQLNYPQDDKITNTKIGANYTDGNFEKPLSKETY